MWVPTCRKHMLPSFSFACFISLLSIASFTNYSIMKRSFRVAILPLYRQIMLHLPVKRTRNGVVAGTHSLKMMAKTMLYNRRRELSTVPWSNVPSPAIHPVLPSTLEWAWALRGEVDTVESALAPLPAYAPLAAF